MSLRSLEDRLRALQVLPHREAGTRIPAPQSREGMEPVTVTVCEPGYRHGDVTLNAPTPWSADLWFGGAPSDLSRCRYFDTETTGLRGGAGTLVFMVGLGRYEGNHLIVDQHFLSHPDEERGMLERVLADLQQATGLISFCGRGFDVPRLADRFLRHGLWEGEERLRGLPHLDLHGLARRVFPHRLPDARLRTCEERLLGFHRHGDLPGAECPEEWFRFQRGQSHRLTEVLRHNHLDIVSLVALEHRLGEAFSEPKEETERLMAAVIMAEARRWDQARALAAVLGGEGADLSRRPSAMLPVVRTLRRLHRAELAQQLLRHHWDRGVRSPHWVEPWSILLERDLGAPHVARRVLWEALKWAPGHVKGERWRQRLHRLGVGGQPAEQVGPGDALPAPKGPESWPPWAHLPVGPVTARILERVVRRKVPE